LILSALWQQAFVIGHSYFAMGYPRLSPFLGVGLDTYGVTIFFSISGYLISGSWINDPTVARYFVKRILRIFPALIVVVLLSVFLLGPAVSSLGVREYLTNPATYKYLQNMFLALNKHLPGVFSNTPSNSVNDPLWSLLPEFLMYLLIPLMALFSRIKTAFVFATVSILLAFSYSFLENNVSADGPVGFNAHDINVFNLFPLAGMGMFFMAGAAIRYAKDRISVRLPFSVLMCVVYVCLYYFSAPGNYALHVMFAFILPCLIISLGESRRIRLPDLSRVGDLSYGIYLYAFPIQQIIAQNLLNKISVPTAILLAYIPTVCFAYASWHLIEKRALALKPIKNTDRLRASSSP
jgi:peptidoglycan/LPS O-acetylase OafA/YrhL